jgi:hypothetical protein
MHHAIIILLAKSKKVAADSPGGEPPQTPHHRVPGGESVGSRDACLSSCYTER